MPSGEATNEPLRCYRCGASLAALSLPLSRFDLCPDCDVELHVCRMCLHFAPTQPDACDEEDAVEVANKTAANFCDYFAPSARAFDGSELEADAAARAALDALFGDETAAPDRGEDSAAAKARQDAEDLFQR